MNKSVVINNLRSQGHSKLFPIC